MTKTVLVACALVLGLSACGDGEKAPAVQGAPAAEQSSSPGAGQDGTTPADPERDPASGGADDDLLGEPVASREASHSGDRMRADLYAVRRSDRLVEVSFSLTVLARAGEDAQGKQISGLFSDGNFDSADSTGHAADGVRLLDPANAKVHVVASDAQGGCLCSRDLSSAFVEVDDSMLFHATFSAPPEDVESVTVTIPTFGAFTGVPVA